MKGGDKETTEPALAEVAGGVGEASKLSPAHDSVVQGSTRAAAFASGRCPSSPMASPPMASPMACYLVGGAVRDKLLGREGGDRDYVVVGATPEAMEAAGFEAVGADFPVFLHPRTKEEYALARGERKSGHGYRGFVFFSEPTVTLREDLRRRDLTINAMAMDEGGAVIDYYGGEADLRARVLRHVSPAFVEDPVRVLRVARFAAALPDFVIADETMALMRGMVASGECGYLRAERVWQELSRGLMTAAPSRMIWALLECGALAVVLPEVAALRGVPERLDYHPEGESFAHTMMVIDTAAERGASLAERFAALLHDIGKAGTPADILPSHHGHEGRSAALAKAVCGRLRVAREVAELAVLAAGLHGKVHSVLDMRRATVVDLLMRLDAFRRPERFESVLRVCEADYFFIPSRRGGVYPQGEFIRAAYRAAAAVDVGAIARRAAERGGAPAAIAEAVRAARITAVKAI